MKSPTNFPHYAGQRYYARLADQQPRCQERRVEQYSVFGRWLHDRALRRGLNLGGLARSLRVSNRAITYWCAGERYPNAVMLVRLRRVLGCSADELLDAIQCDEEGRGQYRND